MSKYSIDELGAMLKSHIKYAEQQLIFIRKQTTKTNGSVADAHKEIGKLNNKWNYVLGFCACFTILFLPVAFAVLNLYMSRK